MPLPLALYLHIPFCAVRCHYCDFNTYAGLSSYHEPYARSLSAEIRRAGEARQWPAVRTIFLGGGTPTVLPAARLAEVLAACREAFEVLPGAEVTCEANPGTADARLFADLAAAGVNRLSMGVQSFDDAELRWLGRIHDAGQAEAAFEAARRAGFANINLDFIFGLPGQELATWERTLARAVALGPEHLSLYGLTVEHGTPLYNDVRLGRQVPPDDDRAADCYELALDRLAQAGYEQYEISNWQRGGHACRHNLVYWRHEPYLGFGAGAHSFDGARRWWNVRPVPEYVARVGDGVSPMRDGETVDVRLAMGEFMMLGLRLVAEGVELARFEARFGARGSASIDAIFGDEVAGLVRRGLLERLPDRLRLTRAGRLLGNQVFAEFLEGSDP